MSEYEDLYDSACDRISELESKLTDITLRLAKAKEALNKIRTSAPCKKDHESFNTPGQLCDQRLAEQALKEIGE